MISQREWPRPLRLVRGARSQRSSHPTWTEQERQQRKGLRSVERHRNVCSIDDVAWRCLGTFEAPALVASRFRAFEEQRFAVVAGGSEVIS